MLETRSQTASHAPGTASSPFGDESMVCLFKMEQDWKLAKKSQMVSPELDIYPEIMDEPIKIAQLKLSRMNGYRWIQKMVTNEHG